MSSLNIKIDKFKGRKCFSLWQSKMQALLKQQGLWAQLAGKTVGLEITEVAILKSLMISSVKSWSSNLLLVCG